MPGTFGDLEVFSLGWCDNIFVKIGRGGIRTHGGLPHARFRVECLKPDSATLPCLQDRHSDVIRIERVIIRRRSCFANAVRQSLKLARLPTRSLLPSSLISVRLGRFYVARPTRSILD